VRIVLTPHTPMGWFALFTVAGGGATVLMVALTWLFLKGVGIWAITQPVAWALQLSTSSGGSVSATPAR